MSCQLTSDRPRGCETTFGASFAHVHPRYCRQV
jgi:hypothetical protein